MRIGQLPTPTIPDGSFDGVALGIQHLCAIELGSSVLCTGDNGYPPPSGKFQSVAVSKNALGLHACAIALDGQLICWGDSPDDAAIAAIGPVRSVDAGSERTCAVKADGFLTCLAPIL